MKVEIWGKIQRGQWILLEVCSKSIAGEIIGKYINTLGFNWDWRIKKNGRDQEPSRKA